MAIQSSQLQATLNFPSHSSLTCQFSASSAPRERNNISFSAGIVFNLNPTSSALLCLSLSPESLSPLPTCHQLLVSNTLFLVPSTTHFNDQLSHQDPSVPHFSPNDSHCTFLTNQLLAVVAFMLILITHLVVSTFTFPPLRGSI